MKNVITKDSEFIIYGAGIFGQGICKNLQKQGFVIKRFLDKRANVLKEYLNIPIVFPAMDCASNREKETIIVIIAIVDFFSHGKIAGFLYDLGFKNIVYNKDVIGEPETESNAIYDSILNNESIINTHIHKIKAPGNVSSFKDHALIRQAGNHIIAYLPLDLLYVGGSTAVKYFTFSPNDLDEYSQKDLPVYSQLYIIELFESFIGAEPIRLKRAIKRFLHWQAAIKQIGEDVAIKQYISDRNKVYKKMSLAFNLDRDYFLRHPVLVEWKKEGYFTIIDGLHRTTFLMLQGIQMIPCKLNKDDYHQWLNLACLHNCVEYFSKHNIDKTDTPIPHGYFYFLSNLHENTYKTRFHTICRYLQRNQIELSGKTFIDLKPGIGYFSRNFYKMGASITSVEFDKQSFELLALFNQLFYCQDIKAVNCSWREINIERIYDISMLIDFKACNALPDLKEINLISTMTENLFIYEMPLEFEPEDIIACSDFISYEKLQENIKFGKPYGLYVFVKRH